jgi:hypothetical protein
MHARSRCSSAAGGQAHRLTWGRLLTYRAALPTSGRHPGAAGAAGAPGHVNAARGHAVGSMAEASRPAELWMLSLRWPAEPGTDLWLP